MTSGSSQPSRTEVLHRFFSGITEYTFTSRLGIADPPLIDYLSALLTHFTRTDAIYGLRSPTGQQLSEVIDMLAEARSRQGPARRRVHRHIGDFTLFWLGVYPETAEKRRRNCKDSFINYQEQGKRNYLIASRLPADEDSAPDDLLEKLSDQYELCVYGLGEVRKQWEEREGNDGVPLLVQ